MAYEHCLFRIGDVVEVYGTNGGTAKDYEGDKGIVELTPWWGGYYRIRFVSGEFEDIHEDYLRRVG